jgi:hypothetical protein
MDHGRAATSLHSRYNPQGEAERYIDSLNLPQDIRFFILIEPGRCYLAPVLRKKNAHARVIALHVEKPAEPYPDENTPDAVWFPEAGTALQDFLEKEIPDTLAGEIRVVQWRPATKLFPKACLKLLTGTAEFIKRGDANARTAQAFGRRWFINFFRNVNLLCNVVVPGAPFDAPVVVAGAGPSLEDALPRIRQHRANAPLVVLAVSSAVPALRAGGVEPDLILATDGGGWALLHLGECVRGHHDKTYYAAALTAALPSQCARLPLLAVSDGSLWQNLVLRALGVPFLALPERGTVSAAAVDLALALSTGAVFIAGLDLAHRGIRTHARPYSFDRLWDEAAGRFTPVYSQVYRRAGDISAGGSHAVYASWFARHIAAYPNRVFSLGDNNEVFLSRRAPSLDTPFLHPRSTLPPSSAAMGALPVPLFETREVGSAETAAVRGASVLTAARTGALHGADSTATLVTELHPHLPPPPPGGTAAPHRVLDEITRAVMAASLATPGTQN